MTADELFALADPTEGTLAEVAQRLRDAVAIESQAGDLASILRTELAARMESDAEVIPHVGVLRRKIKTSTTWRHRESSRTFRTDVFRAVVDEVANDKVTGERDMLRANVARLVTDIIDEALPAFSSIKSSAQHRLRIDMTDYRESVETYTVTLDSEEVA